MVFIEDDEHLWRRLTPNAYLPDGTVTSAAFKGGEKEFSVDIASMTTLAESVNRSGKPCCRLGVMHAKGPRELGHNPVHAPEPGNDAHAYLEGTHPKIPRSLSRKLADCCTSIKDVWSIGSVPNECMAKCAQPS